VKVGHRQGFILKSGSLAAFSILTTPFLSLFIPNK
jgi:hypothetical protein